jgi:outer membrane immunogenic protein
MKRSLVAGFGFLALAAAMPASAADLPRGSAPYRAPAYVAQYNWTGFYLGINGGGAWGASDWNGVAVSNRPSGGMIGGTAGITGRRRSPWCSASSDVIDQHQGQTPVALNSPDQKQLVRHCARPRRLH